VVVVVVGVVVVVNTGHRQRAGFADALTVNPRDASTTSANSFQVLLMPQSSSAGPHPGRE
jgi:hypothetical protein